MSIITSPPLQSESDERTPFEIAEACLVNEIHTHGRGFAQTILDEAQIANVNEHCDSLNKRLSFMTGLSEAEKERIVASCRDNGLPPH